MAKKKVVKKKKTSLLRKWTVPFTKRASTLLGRKKKVAPKPVKKVAARPAKKVLIKAEEPPKIVIEKKVFTPSSPSRRLTAEGWKRRQE